MIHLRLIVPTEDASDVVEHLRRRPGVAHVAHLVPASAHPAGDVVLCDVVREAANEIVEWLQGRGVHHRGAITVESLEAVISDAAAVADRAAPGHGADALIWEEIESRARNDRVLSVSFLVFMAIASVIAAIGILLDSPVLIVGAMVVGPEYGPLSALCVSAVRRRGKPTARAGATLAAGLGLAAVVALVSTIAFRAVGLAPDHYEVTDRQLTAFISQPDGLAAVVAVLAGVVGMLSLTQARAGALIGVLVSVTTIPAVANMGVATAYVEWGELAGAAMQLGINLAGLALAGIVTLAWQARLAVA